MLYELRRNRQFAAAAWAEGVHLGHATIPPDVWALVLQSSYLQDKHGLTEDECRELAGLWQDFESVGAH